MGLFRKKNEVRCDACGIELKKKDKRIRLFEQVYQPKLKSILCVPCAKPVIESVRDELHKRTMTKTNKSHAEKL